ncbi:fused MFS/spermidine synthase [Archangium violaceum]|uniref:fused MFS/spermidine synthase n=1 Tax=Archangium violaceum TaxID=83451 RepID=UPI001951F135|nr:fused MFS/spermidine synthase [Archangium violaceum]QRN96140.1 fused MFS/spermidine synthase [Archangium violaceum]
MSSTLNRTWLGLKVATVLSGAAALIAETLWIRSLTNMVGSTVEAASTIFAAFLAGLALGAWLAGGKADVLRLPLRAYALVEVAIAFTAGAAGLGLFLLRDTLIIGGDVHGVARVALVFFFVLALVLLPTLLMGATFPLMVAAARREGIQVSGVNVLYALNTLGASLGTVACGFVMIPALGVRGSVGAGAVLNLLAAAACVPALLARSEPGPASSSESEAPSEAGSTPDGGSTALPQWVLLLVAASSGLLTLGAEVAWTRLSSYFLGNRAYAFSTLMACVLVSLAVGSWLAERLMRRFGHRLPELLGGVLVLSAGLMMACAAMSEWWIHHQAEVERTLPPAGGVFFTARILQALVLLAPMMLAMGCLFPLSLTASRLTRERSGLAAGLFYLVNTVGSVAGSLLVGFWVLPAVGVYRGIGYLVAFACVMAAVVFGFGVRSRLPKLAGLGAVTVVVTLVPLALPEELVTLDAKEQLVYRAEDRYGVFQVNGLPGGLLSVSNNNTKLVHYLGAANTAYVQQMQGHLALFFRPEAKTAVVLGSGYGITAGALGLYPQLERIDAVEIVPGMVEAADLFMPHNLGYHRNPRVRVVVDDGRHYLTRQKDRFDIVSINISDPRLPGGASLLHSDFYDIVKQRLTEGGVVIQHAFGTEMRLVLSTLGRSFKHVRLFPSYQNGFNVVASDQPLVADPGKIDALTRIPAVHGALRGIGIIEPLRAGEVFSQGLTPEQLPNLFNDSRVATDDFPLLEYSSRGSVAGLFFSNE